MWNCAAHPWVREGGDASDIPLDISVLSNMREFVKYSHLKQIALRVGHILQTFKGATTCSHFWCAWKNAIIVCTAYVGRHTRRHKFFLLYLGGWVLWNQLQALASTLDSDEISDLRDQFDAMDMDRNGTITLDEMRTVSTFHVLYYCVGNFLLATAGIFLSFVCGDDGIWSVDGWVTYNNSLMYLGMCFA